MDNQATNAIMRLKRVLLSDKDNLPNGLTSVLKADVASVMRGYFDFAPEAMKLDIELNAEGRYCVHVDVIAERVKNVKVI